MIVVIYSQLHRRSLSRVSCLPGEVGVLLAGWLAGCWLLAGSSCSLLLRPACVSATSSQSDFILHSSQARFLKSRCPTEEVLEVDGVRAGELYRNLILSEAFQSPSLSSSYQRILFVDIPGLSRLIRSWEWVFCNSWYRLASPPTWRGGKPRSWWRLTPVSWRSTTVRGPSSSTSIRGKFSVAKIECFAKTKYFSIFPSPQCCVEIWETPSQRYWLLSELIPRTQLYNFFIL